LEDVEMRGEREDGTRYAIVTTAQAKPKSIGGDGA
jgi:hypothetical protein